MKTKLTLLAATILVGFSATTASATPTNWSFANGQMEASAKPVGSKSGLKTCFTTLTRYITGPQKGGVKAETSTVCNTGCDTPHLAKNCTSKELKQCVN
jgi:hypothetical protein